MTLRFYTRLPWLRVPRFMIRIESGTMQGFRWPISIIFPDAQFRAQAKPINHDELNKP